MRDIIVSSTIHLHGDKIMSLDFVIAYNKSDAGTAYPDLSLEDEDHESLSSEMAKDNRTMLNRISDYYADATFQGSDLIALSSELASANKSITAIDQLAKLVETALHQNKNIYVFAD